MILNNRLNISYRTEHLEDMELQQFTDDCIEREIMYDAEVNEFTELTPYDGIELIDNIYREILPIYVELIQRKQKDIVIKDLRGNLTLISVIPF